MNKRIRKKHAERLARKAFTEKLRRALRVECTGYEVSPDRKTLTQFFNVTLPGKIEAAVIRGTVEA